MMFSKQINSIIGDNLSKLFNRDNTSLRRAEIYIDDNKGINCSYGKEYNVWPLGEIVLKQLLNVCK